MSNILPDSDLQKLIDDAANGDDIAFAKLLERYAPLITAEVSRFKSCGLDDDDFRQEAYIAFFGAVKSYMTSDRTVSFGLYAKICIKNRLISAVRRLSKHSQLLSEDDIPETVDVDNDPYYLVANQEDLEVFRYTLNRLLSVYEKTILHYYIAGFSPSEISDRIGKDERSVSNALFRIRGKLKCLLHDR